jgi:hypothetical protein
VISTYSRPASLPQVHIDNDPEKVADLVRQLVEQTRSIVDARNVAVVIAAYDKHAAVGIGEAADRT